VSFRKCKQTVVRVLLTYSHSSSQPKTSNRLYSHCFSHCPCRRFSPGRSQADHSYMRKQILNPERETSTSDTSVNDSHIRIETCRKQRLTSRTTHNQENIQAGYLTRTIRNGVEVFLDSLLFTIAGEEHTRKARAFVKEKLAKAQSVCVPAEHHDEFEKVCVFRLTTCPLACWRHLFFLTFLRATGGDFIGLVMRSM
jgi:hypothetical protein